MSLRSFYHSSLMHVNTESWFTKRPTEQSELRSQKSWLYWREFYPPSMSEESIMERTKTSTGRYLKAKGRKEKSEDFG